MIPRRRVLAILAVASICASASLAQDSELFQCQPGWELRGLFCYKFFNVQHSWRRAADLCRRYGSDLVVVESFQQNNVTAKLARAAKHNDAYWLGLMSLDDLSTNTLEAASGSLVSQYAGFWQTDQPDAGNGECVRGHTNNPDRSWALSTCESLLPFVCRAKACPKGSFLCSNGKCINDALRCDNQNDCGDHSDEKNCPEACHYYMSSSGDSFDSPNYPSRYKPLADCKWTLEGPVGTSIVLQFSEFETEKTFDTVQILSGGGTEDASITLATLSGKQDLSSQFFISASNFMIVKFRSDATVEKGGFRASWKTEPLECIKTLQAIPQGQELVSPGFPQSYPGGLECLYVISAPQGKVVTLKIEEFDMELDKDYVLVRDGPMANSPRLALLTGDKQSNPLFLQSTGNVMYLYVRTDLSESRRGFRFRYSLGCDITLEMSNGTISSPGFGMHEYPANQECSYHLRGPGGAPLSLRFTDFNLDDSDNVLAYDGSNSNGVKLHPGSGFSGKTVPKLTLTASSGDLLLRFVTDPLRSGKGWKAVFSADCPMLKPGDHAIASTRDTAFGTEVTFTCPRGHEFATGVTNIVTRCQPGGQWSVSYIPKCQEVYCGPVPQIDNGFAIAATNVTYQGEATYQCYAGFGFPSNMPTETISCTEAGQWEALPTCLASQCPPLSEVAHANTTVLNGVGRNYGTVIRYECDPGYQRNGLPVLLCQSNGTWSADVPSCSKKHCRVLPEIENGLITNTSRDYFFGDEARVQCHRGFRLNGSNIIRCGPDAEFLNIPTCIDIDECAQSQCDSASTICTNLPGSYHCSCKTGFAPNLDCRPVADLGLGNGGIASPSITVSGSEKGFPKENVRLNSKGGWCGSETGPASNWVMVDLKAKTIIRGFRTQPVLRGASSGLPAFASSIRLQYADDLDDVFKEYRSPEGAPVEFRIPEGTSIAVVNLPSPVEARYIRLVIQDYTIAPCLRMELMGCIRQECNDINECAVKNGGCNQKCINNPGSFGCACDVGYELFAENGTAGFNIADGESGMRDGDMFRLNKTCVRKMCPAIVPPQNGIHLTTRANHHFGDLVTFQCNFGHILVGSATIQCTSSGTWNASVPECQFAQCVALQDDPTEGLTVERPNTESLLVPFGQNVTLHCNEIGRPATKTLMSSFRQCVYNPGEGFPQYWLAGAQPSCPRVDCGTPPDSPGAVYGGLTDTRFGSSFFFGCQPTFKFAGQSLRNDNVVRCTEDGSWDFGDLRCEGPVCQDPGRPADGIQIATSYEQGSEISFECSKPGYIPITDQPIQCVREPECKVVRPIGITSGLIPDSAINATSERFNYEARNVRLNSGTGWCAQQEAFTYVSIDLGIVHRVKAILVKGVVTNDVVGRPTELRFFYKQDTADNYVVYFPNFNLTSRDPGNYGELAMITLPLSVQARFVILGIVSYDKNPCLKFELMGCPDTPDEDRLLGYDLGYPVCVDNDPPQFINCPTAPIVVQKGPRGWLPVNFTLPTATDNSGMIARTEVRPEGFHVPVQIFEDTMVEYLAYDFDGNVAICQINITVPDETPPKLKCPQSFVIELVEPRDDYEVFFNETRRRVETSDASGDVTIKYIPESATIRLGSYQNVTVVAEDPSGNKATCHFQVSVLPTQCVDWELKPPVNGAINCLPSNKNEGLECVATCNPGFKFTDGQPVKTFTCGVGKPWLPSHVVPDCVSLDTDQANYHVVSKLLYRANGAVPALCLSQYASQMQNVYPNLDRTLSQRCSAVTLETNVSFVDTKAIQVEDNVVELSYVLSVMPAARLPQLYDLCGSTLGLAFDLSVPSTSAVIEPLLGVPSIGSDCPTMRATNASVSRGFACGTGEVLEMSATSSVPRCLHCPAGTFAVKEAKSCSVCPQGTYQDQARQGECKRCPAGTFTRSLGSKSVDECIPVCGYGTFSPTGLVPCLECPRDSYTGAPPADGHRECLRCPENTFTYQPAAPSVDTCRAKCEPGTYSDTGLAPCAPCPANFYQPLEGQTTCFECPSAAQTVGEGAKSRDQCQAIVCQQGFCKNGGLCIAQAHMAYCVCAAGFEGRFCEMDINDCASEPCYNGGTCTDMPQGYKCQCPPGYSGLQCQEEESSCGNNTCPGRAMCKNEPGFGNFKCLCRTGYGGPDCSITVDPCLDNPCGNEGECVALKQGRFKCICKPGWEGRLCNKNIDDCAGNPCLLGANCTDLVNDFACKCPTGFTGKRCEQKVDLCSANPCVHGVCVDRFFAHVCLCQPGWTGRACDTPVDECRSNPCLNNGTCLDLDNDFRCICATGFTGKNCQHSIDYCASEPCQHGATCTNSLEGFVCQCRPGFLGLQCETDVDECLDNPCDPIGTDRCLDQVNKYKCQCRPGFVGELCETNVNECAPNPCLNGGLCTEGINDFKCTCPAGWTGKRCETDIAYCSSDPCLNSATCLDLLGDFFCACPSGTDGKRCETAPERCIGNPCMNEGICRDFGSGLNCSCSNDYVGIGCEHEFDACAANVCKNGATCVDNGPGYKCMCPSGYTGVHCEEDIQDCVPGACPLAATCVDLKGGFYCRCPFNLTGEDCRKTITIDYDLHFSDDTRSSSASQVVPFGLGASSLTLALWVRFANKDDSGTLLTLYSVDSPTAPTNKNILAQIHSSGVHIALIPGVKDVFLPFKLSVSITDGQWHHVALVWDGQTGVVVLTSDGVIVGRLENYARNATMPPFGYVTLGSPLSDSPLRRTEQGFQGYLSRVYLWNRPLDVNKEIPKQVRSCQSAPVMFDGLLLQWSGYDRLIGGVDRIMPSACGQKACPPGYTGTDCENLVQDKIPPKVTRCPGDIWVETKNGSARVDWEEPVFTDNIRVARVMETKGFRSGNTLSWGNYQVAYVAYDDAGNAATCAFKVYVLGEFCPRPADPVGGSQRCSDWGPGGRFKVCSIECNPGLAFSVAVPKFYTCGAEGFWRPTEDSSVPFVYPACSATKPAQRLVKVKLQYLSSVLCNEAGQSVLSEKVRQALMKLNREWRFCSDPTNRGSPTCNDLDVNIKCQRRPGIVKRQVDNEDVYDIEISFPAESDPVTNVNTQEKTTIQKLLETLILEQDDLDVVDSLPNTVRDPSSLNISADFTCGVGQVVRGSDCVPCASGTFYDSESRSCKVCPIGTFQDQVGQTQCNTCPVIAGRPGITFATGSRSAVQCKERCPAGKFYSEDAQRCLNCGFGHYQPEEGSFKCRSCSAGLTTRTDQAVSEQECSEECPTGHQLTSLANNATCELCPVGTYRTKGREMTCQPCPSDRTTEKPGAGGAEECTIPRCKPGNFLSMEEKACKLCARGTYQPNAQQKSCLSCPADTSTAELGATSRDQCTNPCSESANTTLCHENAICLLNRDQNVHRCECKVGFEGDGTNCTDRCEGFCKNEGICKKKPTGEPTCQCTGSFTGKTCEDKSEFAYIAGGIAGAVVFVILVILLIWMICVRTSRRKDTQPKVAPSVAMADPNGSQANFYYASAAPYAESIAPSHHSAGYAHYYDEEEDGWEMPNFYNETYMKENLASAKMNSLARSNASLYGNKDELYDRLRRHAYQGPQKEKSGNETSDSEGH